MGRRRGEPGDGGGAVDDGCCRAARLARARGGLSVFDFVKLVTVQEYSKTGVRQLGPAALLLAESEVLAAHATAIRARMGDDGVPQ